MYNGKESACKLGNLTMPKRKPALIFTLCLLACSVSGAQVKIIGPEGVTIEDLIREETYVTFVLKVGAVSENYQITGIHAKTATRAGTITFKTDKNKDSAYELWMVKEIRVQDERLAQRRRLTSGAPLSNDELKIIGQATQRALEIFVASKGNQDIRMSAALVLAASTHERKSDSLRYLQGLAGGNDVPTAMAATTLLYLAGIPADREVIQAGFESGNRQAKASAARLAGLTNNTSFLPELRTMLHDPTIETFPSAAKAIGRMDERSGLSELYGAMRALTEVKGEAAVFALSRMGGEEVHQKMLEMLEETKGVEWFRVLRVLYALEDDRAKELMEEVALEQPAYQRTAALLLAADQVWEGTLFLRNYLEKAVDPNLKNLVFKAKVAETLFTAGDIQAKNLLQELVNIKPSAIYVKGRTSDVDFKTRTATEVQLNALILIENTGSRNLLSLLVGPVESVNPLVAISACMAAVAIGNPEFGDRLKEMRY